MKRAMLGFVLAAAVVGGVSAGAQAGSKDDGWIKLFNGKNLNGWKPFIDPKKTDVKPEDVWSVEGDTIVCKGHVNGYLVTNKDYGDYILKVEWKWGPKGPAKGKRNSGVFVHVTGPDKIWPKAIEAQLMEGNAGDFWLVGDFKLDVDPARQDPKIARHYYRTIKDGVEKDIGEWNQYEITCKGNSIKLVINGKKVNDGKNAELTKGKILLQSEGAEIHFRNVQLKPLTVVKKDEKKVETKKDDKKVESKKDDKKVETKKDDKAPKFQTMDDYYNASDAAFKDKKRVLVIVGISRPDLEKEFKDYIIVRVDKFPGVGKAGVVVGVPNPRWLSRFDFPPNVNAQQIRQSLPAIPKKQ